MTHQSNQVQEKLQETTTGLVTVETKDTSGTITRPRLPANVPN